MPVATPYLFFPGTCREAFTAYAEILGIAAPIIVGFGEVPAPEGAAPDAVMHAALDLGEGGWIYASDDVSTPPGPPMAGCNVHLSFDRHDDAEEAFARLSEGGAVRMPFAPAFWSPGFGACTDRWGTRWMISCEDGPAGD